MKIRYISILEITFILGIIISAPLPLQAELDFGDHSSQTLSTKAWDAFGSGAHNDALGYIQQCVSMYQAEAKSMQAELTAYPPNEPQEATSKYWALNDVGTCLFIKGESLLKKGDSAGAKQAFTKLVTELKYAQCWDPKGWFWKPADAAKQKLIEIEFDEE